MYQTFEKRFIRINLIAIISLFVLILAGGVVRSTGSGMGCPDWPKCFDQYIPPTHSSQLPEGYQQKYVVDRVAKNQRFAQTLDVLGYGELAERVRKDESILKPEEFNASRTWTEYINRLIGALTGVFLLGCVIFAFPYLKSRKRIFFLSLINVFLVGFQAWMGSIVVSTNLLAWVVTVHMLLALAILAVTIYTYYDARFYKSTGQTQPNIILKGIAWLVFLLTIIQITLGTEVREQVDAVAAAMNQLNRGSWLGKVGVNFELHRDLAILVLAGNFLLFRFLSRIYAPSAIANRMMVISLGLIAAQIVSGVVLSYLALAPAAQAAHIVLACLLFGAQLYLLLTIKHSPLAEKGGQR